jgi:hypothetical protein
MKINIHIYPPAHFSRHVGIPITIIQNNFDTKRNLSKQCKVIKDATKDNTGRYKIKQETSELLG